MGKLKSYPQSVGNVYEVVASSTTESVSIQFWQNLKGRLSRFSSHKEMS